MTRSDEAAEYIMNHCRFMGSYSGDGSPYRFLARLAEEMVAAPHTVLFPERYKEHVAYALGMIARQASLSRRRPSPPCIWRPGSSSSSGCCPAS